VPQNIDVAWQNIDAVPRRIEEMPRRIDHFPSFSTKSGGFWRLIFQKLPGTGGWWAMRASHRVPWSGLHGHAEP